MQGVDSASCSLSAAYVIPAAHSLLASLACRRLVAPKVVEGRHKA